MSGRLPLILLILLIFQPYNYLLHKIIIRIAFLTRLPVYSFVIYLREDDYIVEPPYLLKGVRGEILQIFNYKNILLWEIPVEELQHAGLEGLFPLLPLTKGAKTARDTIIDTMVGALQAKGLRRFVSLRICITGKDG